MGAHIPNRDGRNTTDECHTALLEGWMHLGRHKVVRLDFDETCQTECWTPALCHCSLGAVSQIKRTATLYVDEGQRSSSECLTMACLQHSILLKRGRYTPVQLVLGHAPELVEGEPLNMDKEGLEVTYYMAEERTILETLAERCESDVLESRRVQISSEQIDF